MSPLVSRLGSQQQRRLYYHLVLGHFARASRSAATCCATCPSVGSFFFLPGGTSFCLPHQPPRTVRSPASARILFASSAAVSLFFIMPSTSIPVTRATQLDDFRSSRS